jgi:hypothetical protein
MEYFQGRSPASRQVLSAEFSMRVQSLSPIVHHPMECLLTADISTGAPLNRETVAVDKGSRKAGVAGHSMSPFRDMEYGMKL